MAPVPGSPWKCVSRMTSLPPSPHTHTYIYAAGGAVPWQSSEGRKAASVVGPQPTPDDHFSSLSQGLVDWGTELPHM